MLKTRLLALLFTLMVALPAFAADKTKVVYHLSDPDKAAFVLNNIRNPVSLNRIWITYIVNII